MDQIDLDLLGCRALGSHAEHPGGEVDAGELNIGRIKAEVESGSDGHLEGATTRLATQPLS